LLTIYVARLDFWTTKCTRCPDALDKLDDMAKDPKYKDVQFVSICCDKLDGARDIIEKEDDLRWQNIHHYFMSKEDKETAKRLLGFQQVPFYVVLDENGNIQQSGGGKQVDFADVPGIVRPNSPPSSPIINFQSYEGSKSCIDEVGLMSELSLDFPTNVGMVGGASDKSSNPIQVIDESFFDNDDF
jgi:thiol-disulfide isomerase/thioredoxin